MQIETKLTESQLALACMSNGVSVNRQNMAVAAFLNDADFREKVTRFYFERAVAQVKG